MLPSFDTPTTISENSQYLTEQLITYLGNKRSLLDFIRKGVEQVQKQLNKEKLDIFDVFSGSGIVSRYFKQFSKTLYSNDLEKYATIIGECYLTNNTTFPHSQFKEIYNEIISQLNKEHFTPSLITKLYAPADDRSIKHGERAFYTCHNAQYLDTARLLIEKIPREFQKYLLAPLLSEASIHANTSGVFKGFYKNSDTGIGQFGGKKRDAINRITKDIKLLYPIFSNFSCDYKVLNSDANIICKNIPEVDIAYLDPPYNQHPYGSNYFMLNLFIDYKMPEKISEVSGIPDNWKRSDYNKSQGAYIALSELIQNLKAKFILLSFNSEGFIKLKEMKELLAKYGKVTVLETKYNTFRGSRNLSNRKIHIKEYLYLLEK